MQNHALLREYDARYYNGESIIPDEEYDRLKEVYEKTNGEYNHVGYEPKGTKVALPVYMGSMNKTNDFSKWVTGSVYSYQDKIDGVSLLYTPTGLYTRGNGTIGTCITSALSTLRLPTCPNGMMIRGELVIHKNVFEHVKGDSVNPRNYVSGMVNRKNGDLSGCVFYAFALYTPACMENNSFIYSPAQQLETLRSLGFHTPEFVVSTAMDEISMLSYLQSRRKAAPYVMDGLVISNETGPWNILVGKNPSYAIAFKPNLETYRTVVTDVVWKASMSKRLAPVVRFNPVIISGCSITSASGYNGRWIKTHGIGPGAEISIVRSQDTIPKIVEVHSPVQVSEPSGVFDGVDYVLDHDTEETIVARLTHFVDTVGMNGFQLGKIKQLYDSGITTLDELLAFDPNGVVIQGWDKTTKNNFITERQRALHDIPREVFMAASGYFIGTGLGVARIKEILQNGSRVGILADRFKERIGDYTAFEKRIEHLVSFKKEETHTDPELPLYGKTVVFSGVRNESLQRRAKELGGTIAASVSKKTGVLVVKDTHIMTTKVSKAKELGVKIMTIDEFSEYVKGF